MRTISYGHRNQPKGDIHKPIREAEISEQNRITRQALELEKQLREEIAEYVTGSKQDVVVKELPQDIRYFILLERVKKRGKGSGMSMLDTIALQELARKRVIGFTQES